MTATETQEFLEWWAEYPKKIGREPARIAYSKARKKTTADALRAGLHRLLMHLDADPKFWPRASTWLNQQRWEDDYNVVPVSVLQHEETRADCRHEPKCVSTEWHRILLKREQESSNGEVHRAD